MSVFKKSSEGFLAKLFKHKQVEKLAEELAHTYADEMQENMLTENAKQSKFQCLKSPKQARLILKISPKIQKKIHHQAQKKAKSVII